MCIIEACTPWPRWQQPDGGHSPALQQQMAALGSPGMSKQLCWVVRARSQPAQPDSPSRTLAEHPPKAVGPAPYSFCLPACQSEETLAGLGLPQQGVERGSGTQLCSETGFLQPSHAAWEEGKLLLQQEEPLNVAPFSVLSPRILLSQRCPTWPASPPQPQLAGLTALPRGGKLLLTAIL